MFDFRNGLFPVPAPQRFPSLVEKDGTLYSSAVIGKREVEPSHHARPPFADRCWARSSRLSRSL
jgi:hypothetical protein